VLFLSSLQQNLFATAFNFFASEGIVHWFLITHNSHVSTCKYIFVCCDYYCRTRSQSPICSHPCHGWDLSKIKISCMWFFKWIFCASSTLLILQSTLLCCADVSYFADLKQEYKPRLKCWWTNSKCSIGFAQNNESTRHCRIVCNTVFHRWRSKQIFGGAKTFWLNFPKLAQKVVVQLLPTVFVVWPPQKGSLLVFLLTLGAIFRSQTTLGAIFAQIFRNSA